MRKFTSILLAIALALIGCQALAQQTGNATITYYPSDPFGGCSKYRLWWNTTSNVLWVCEGNGAWVSTGAGGSGVPTFPLLATCGTTDAPNYALGNAEMGTYCTGVDGSLVIQNRDSTPNSLGRARLTLGVEQFSLNATRSEDVNHNGNIQCFDESGPTMTCRIDATDAAGTGTYGFTSGAFTLNTKILSPDGADSLPSYSFSNCPECGINFSLNAGNPYIRFNSDPASGLNAVGGDLSLTAGAGTGTGRAGWIRGQIAVPSATSSSTPQALQNAFILSGTDGAVSIGQINVEGTPGAGTYSAPSRATGISNSAGGDLSLNGGVGTGSGSGGSIRLKVAPAGGSGSTQNALQNAIVISGASTPTITTSYQILAPDGSKTASSYAFATATNAGWSYDPFAPGYLVGTGRYGSGTDATGGNIQLAAGRSTGTGVGGSIELVVSPPGASSGSSLNAHQSVAFFRYDNAITIGGMNTVGAPGTASLQGSNRATGQTDGAGGDTWLRGGTGTGTGAGGNVTLWIAPPAATTGTSQHSFFAAATFSGANASVVLGGVDAPTGGTSSLTGAGSTGSNVAGGALNIVGGRATNGNANGGDVTLVGGTPVGSGVAGRIIIPNGTAANPGVVFAGALTTGFYSNSGIGFSVSGTAVGRWDANALAIGSTLDAGWRRANTNTLRATDGAQGFGYVIGGQPTFQLTASSTAATQTDGGLLYHNNGQGATRTVTLVDNPAAGTCYDFVVLAAQSLTITPGAGETFRDVAATGSTQITSNTVGSAMRLCAVAGGSTSAWIVMWKNGTWTIS
jgi:hypothetical protein